MRTRIRAQRRRVQWENGASFLPYDSLLIPTVAGTSTYVAAWFRVPAATFDTVNDREVPVDWTLIREINECSFTAYNNAGGGASMSFLFGAGVIAWDGVNDTPPDPLATPLPVQQGGLDWLWHWVNPWQSLVTSGGQVIGQNLDAPEGMVFGKSQRKLSAGTGLLFVAEMYATEDSMNGYWGYSHHGRYAFKLP